jgi:methylenetetrahydrofolate reductase (NADPH)
MRIQDLLERRQPAFSFEFFPPKTPPAVDKLLETVRELAVLEPAFVSVTYGAAGSTRDRTIDLVTRIRGETGIEAMAHLTCVGHTAGEIDAILDRLRTGGVDNVLALRGDAPAGQRDFQPVEGGFRYGSELVAHIRSGGHPFSIGGACYPEGHIECLDRELDLQHLLQKVHAGTDFLITQLFFDNAFYFDFVGRARRAGINVPIIPGIMPITGFEQVNRFTRLCGATIPMRLLLELERRQGDPDAIAELGVAHATLQCADLLRRGVPGIHFYTLNRSSATRMIVAALRAQGLT